MYWKDYRWTRRRVVCDLVRPEARGAVLLELSDAVRATLIADMKENEIPGAVEYLESQDIADLVPSLPRDTVSALFDTLDHEYRPEVQAMLEFRLGTVGSLRRPLRPSGKALRTAGRGSRPTWLPPLLLRVK